MKDGTTKRISLFEETAASMTRCGVGTIGGTDGGNAANIIPLAACYSKSAIDLEMYLSTLQSIP